MSQRVTKSVDAYINKFPDATRVILKKIRQIIYQAVPKAEESISYGMAAYKLNGKPLVYFAGWKTHIGFYATPSGNVAFQKELAKYNPSKGAVQFPLEKTVPYGLIKKIVLFRVKEVKAKKK